MKIDGPFYADLAQAADEARRLAGEGYDGVYTLEGSRDPFLPLVTASATVPDLDIATGIAVAFPRNPSHIAYTAWDLQRFSQGRFRLGIGSQVQAHIEKRFGVPFAPAAARMREYILAVKAFFACWQDGAPLDFQGEYFRHTLMTPMFNPGPNPYGKPPILLGALGPKMTEVAAEVADGLIVHPFNTDAFVRQQQLPAVNAGLVASGRQRQDFLMQVTAICVTGQTAEEYAAAERSVRGLLAFYGSTPAYKPPMDAVGYGDLQPELNRLSKAGRWDDMAALIDDGFLKAFAVCAEPKDLAQGLWQRYGDYADRLSIYAPYASAPGVWPGILADLKRLAGRSG